MRIAYLLAVEDSISQDYHACRNTYSLPILNYYAQFNQEPLVRLIANGDVWDASLPVVALALDETTWQPNPQVYDSIRLANSVRWYGTHLDTVSTLLQQFKEVAGLPKTHPDIEEFQIAVSQEQIPQKLAKFFRTDTIPTLKVYFDPLNNITNKAVTFMTDRRRHLVIGYFCNNAYTNPEESISLQWNSTYRRILFHETAHLYTSSLLDKYYDKELKQLVAQEKHQKSYTDIDEIIVRGLAAKAVAFYYNEEAGQADLVDQPEASAIVYAELDKYLANPSMNFEEVYAEIISKLKVEFR
jgi:hypothetical protein